MLLKRACCEVEAWNSSCPAFSVKNEIATVASQSHQGISFFWTKAVFCHDTYVLREE